MICSICATENRAARKFCLKCGTLLATGCPNCGAENEAEAAFCGNCGTSLGLPAPTEAKSTIPKSDPVAERRLVTVLFADLVGFTPFAEERDAEEVRDTLERYAAVAREVIGRYGGTVEKFIGDAVMAVWGTPTAHEDDAERAVRAALELTDAVAGLGPGIQARAGILTGEAAVNLGATDQNLLAGDLVNTASRLQSVAPPGTVLAGESTMRATSSSVAYEPAGDQLLKGKSAPIPAWQALRVIAQRRGAGRADNLETPFVGRDAEIRLLRDQLHLSSRDPRARLVSITGPAGIGKSRLAWELEKYVDGIVETIYWHRGRCPAYGEGVSFWALGEMVRRRAGLAEGDDGATTRQGVHDTVTEYVADESDRDWIEQALLVLLGAEDELQSGRETLFAAWRRFFEHIAARGTTVLVFEDLHWADAGLLDFIDHLLDWSKRLPVLVVTLARPELFDRRLDWGAGRRHFTALALDPLSDAAVREMLNALVADLPEAALGAITSRADGIPLYAVETVRMLLADGRLTEVDGEYRTTRELGSLEVPDSLRSLITARLDALDGTDRRLLQDASVLGNSFTVGALGGVNSATAGELDSRLRQLVRRELLTVEADPRSPERGQYGFTQSLIREVAYSTLSRADRRDRHLAAARYLEGVGSEELAGALAGHYLSAHQASAPGPEADAVAVQARLALRAAADRAAALGGHKQAAAFLDQALAVTTAPSERGSLLEAQALEYDLAGRYDESETSGKAAIDSYLSAGDAVAVARTRSVLGAVRIDAARITDALAILEQARSEMPADAPPVVAAGVLARLAQAYYRNRQPQRSLETVEQALEVAEHHQLRYVLADAMVIRGTALSMAARPREALVVMRGGVELARREGNTPAFLRGSANLMGLLATEESATDGIAVSRAALEVSRNVGNLSMIVWHLGNLLIGACFAGLPMDQLIEEVTETLALDLAPSDRRRLLTRMVPAYAFLGRDVSDLVAQIETLPSPDDTQTIASHEFEVFLTETAGGNYSEAARYAADATEKAPAYGLTALAGVLAFIAGDEVGLRRLVDREKEMPQAGPAEAAIRAAANGIVSGLDGRPDLALAGLREGWRVLREKDDVLQSGMIVLGYLRLLGPDVPEVRAAGEEAAANFEHMGALRLAGEIRAALGSPEGVTATEPGRVAEPVRTASPTG